MKSLVDSMNSGNVIISHATLVTPVGDKALKGADMGRLKVVEDTTVVVEGGRIAYIGSSSDPVPTVYSGFEVIDAEGRALLPGFVDSHTHMMFGGYRPHEFALRMKGATYMEIMEAGGGIQSTVDATRKATPDELTAKTRWFIDKMVSMGVTTAEVKSGYGLSLEEELKMLEVAGWLASDSSLPLHLAVTFMGAHVVPPEYKGKPGEYIDHIVNDMLPRVKGLAEFCDVFTEKGVFGLEDSRKLLEAAKAVGMKPKVHADEIVTLGGAGMAVETGAVSADHLLHVSDEDIVKLAQSGTVATLLPLTAFSLKEEYAPARKLIDAGAAVALATDLNPGSCFSGSIPLMIALACIYMQMTPEETVTAMTLNGAAALDMAAETGSIETGKWGDLIILDFDDYKMLPYYIGMNCVRTVISRGRKVYDSNGRNI